MTMMSIESIELDTMSETGAVEGNLKKDKIEEEYQAHIKKLVEKYEASHLCNNADEIYPGLSPLD